MAREEPIAHFDKKFKKKKKKKKKNGSCQVSVFIYGLNMPKALTPSQKFEAWVAKIRAVTFLSWLAEIFSPPSWLILLLMERLHFGLDTPKAL